MTNKEVITVEMYKNLLNKLYLWSFELTKIKPKDIHGPIIPFLSINPEISSIPGPVIR